MRWLCYVTVNPCILHQISLRWPPTRRLWSHISNSPRTCTTDYQARNRNVLGGVSLRAARLWFYAFIIHCQISREIYGSNEQKAVFASMRWSTRYPWPKSLTAEIHHICLNFLLVLFRANKTCWTNIDMIHVCLDKYVQSSLSTNYVQTWTDQSSFRKTIWASFSVS